VRWADGRKASAKEKWQLRIGGVARGIKGKMQIWIRFPLGLVIADSRLVRSIAAVPD